MPFEVFETLDYAFSDSDIEAANAACSSAGILFEFLSNGLYFTFLSTTRGPVSICFTVADMEATIGKFDMTALRGEYRGTILCSNKIVYWRKQCTIYILKTF